MGSVDAGSGGCSSVVSWRESRALHTRPPMPIIADISPPEKRARELRSHRRGVRRRLHHRPGDRRLAQEPSARARLLRRGRHGAAQLRLRLVPAAARRCCRGSAVHFSGARANPLGTLLQLREVSGRDRTARSDVPVATRHAGLSVDRGRFFTMLRFGWSQRRSAIRSPSSA